MTENAPIPVELEEGENEVRKIEGVKLEGGNATSTGFLLLTNHRLIFNGKMETRLGRSKEQQMISCEWTLRYIRRCEIQKPPFGKRKLAIGSPQVVMKTRIAGQITPHSIDQSLDDTIGICMFSEINQPDEFKTEIEKYIEQNKQSNLSKEKKLWEKLSHIILRD